jgi:cyclophilin family peptidyl-prolyl cis-trans isomerase
MPKIKHSKKGLISMVSVGENLFGSQFFITLDDDLDYLVRIFYLIFIFAKIEGLVSRLAE